MISPFILILKTYNLNVEIHKHAAYQIVVSESKPFSSVINDTFYENILGFAIQPHVTHLCTAVGSAINIINVEPYSTLGFNIASKFSYHVKSVTFRTHKETNGFFEIERDDFDISKVLDAISHSISLANSDERVATIVDFINSNYQRQDISPKTFSNLVFLSPSRLAALFKQQTGSSISKYLLWTRLRQAIYLSLTDKNRTLTDIAYSTGFYDLPQLNKYMYEMFGVPPTALKHNSDLIQVFDN